MTVLATIESSILDSATETIEGAEGITEGFIYGYLPADTTVAGNYVMKFSMTDSQGKTSNIVEATFTVIPVALLLSIDVTPANPTILVIQRAPNQALGQSVDRRETVRRPQSLKPMAEGEYDFIDFFRRRIR